MLKTVLLAAAFTLAAQAAAASPPIPLKMARGSDSITVKGVLNEKSDCCTYSFEAAAGQKLHVSETGANAHMLIHFPSGDTDGPYPGPYTWTLPATGTYLLEVSPNSMEGTNLNGPFTLTLRIPPK
jgi:hypothetical protein